MPIQSKYSGQQVQALVDDLIATLNQHQAGTDLALMALGNVLSNLFEQRVDAQHREALVQQFSQALQKSLK